MADYSKTVNLPKTDFPMKAELPKREPEILEFWAKIDLYRKMQEANKGKPLFVLHDGPPYANGHIHIGHALNKILKDMTVKSKSMDGRLAPYVPGWDCHGLPIEQQLLKEMAVDKRSVKDLPAFRKAAAAFAQRWIDIQRAEFRRLGGAADWEHPYTTMQPEYESAILRAFRVLLNAGYIYRSLKPVYWCSSHETALAEAEVEYKEKTSPSVFVAFPVLSGPFKLQPGEEAFVLIWTTTPWTLPANSGLAFHPDLEYVRVRIGSELRFEATDPEPRQEELPEPPGAPAPQPQPSPGSGSRGAVAQAAVLPKVQPKKVKNVEAFKTLILAKVRHAAVLDQLGIRDYKVVEERMGSEFEGLKAENPLGFGGSTGVLAEHVSSEDGTGIVHIAPGHGREDFDTGRRYNLPIKSPVDGAGRFTHEAGAFAGLKVDAANEKIIESLRIRGRLFGAGHIQHSYPHCWRCKHPIIFRATEQWFLSVDHQGLRDKLLAEADRVKWMPEVGKSRISGMLKMRPDWCLSRQRIWGTPIPVVYCDTCGKPVVDNEVLLAIETRAAKEGTDFWFAEEPAQFLPAGLRCGACGGGKFRKETDILDVWMDSGCSWLGVLKGHQQFPADLYLEGSDQHRGWFQSSVVLSMAMEGTAPYQAVLTHGFVLDEIGRAMHKSLGNVVSPQTVVDDCGADVLRLWVALSDVEADVRLSQKLLDGPKDMYVKVRNTLRYLLGNIFDFDPERHAVPYAELPELDRFILHCLAFLIHEVKEDYRHFRFRAAIRAVSDFCINDLSSFYLAVIKDRLYVLRSDDKARRSAQTVLHHVLVSLARLMAPVLSFTAEEAWQNLAKGLKAQGSSSVLEESVFLAGFPEAHEDWFQTDLELRWRRILDVRAKVNLELERARKAGSVKSSGEARVTLGSADAEETKFLGAYAPLWTEILLVAEACVGETANNGAGGGLGVRIEPAPGKKCARCWQRRPDVGQAQPDLCSRCAAVLAAS